MTNKGIKTENLRNWYATDYILFGKPAKSCLNEESYKQYLSTKAAMLSNIYEMWIKINHDTNLKFDSVEKLHENSIDISKEVLEHAGKIMQSDIAKKYISDEVKQVGLNEDVSEKSIVDYVVNKRLKAIAIDALTLESTSDRNSLKSFLESWEGKVCFDAHKALRDNLVELSLC